VSLLTKFRTFEDIDVTVVSRYAYVDFATVEAKTSAIALSEQPLLGRKLLIKDGTSMSSSLSTWSNFPTLRFELRRSAFSRRKP
jgi:hypothetical protein